MEMTAETLSAIITLCGTAIGTFGGIIASSKLTSYRIEQLEKKVAKHNNLIDRMYAVESKIEVIENKISVNNHRIEEIEEIEKERK